MTGYYTGSWCNCHIRPEVYAPSHCLRQRVTNENGTILKLCPNAVQHLDVGNIYICFHFWSFPQNVWDYGDAGPYCLPKISSKRLKIFLTKINWRCFESYSKAVVLFLIDKYNHPTFQIMGKMYFQPLKREIKCIHSLQQGMHFNQYSLTLWAYGIIAGMVILQICIMYSSINGKLILPWGHCFPCNSLKYRPGSETGAPLAPHGCFQKIHPLLPPPLKFLCFKSHVIMRFFF